MSTRARRKRRKHGRIMAVSCRLLLILALLCVVARQMDAREARLKAEEARRAAGSQETDVFTPDPWWEPEEPLPDPRFPDVVEPEEDENEKIVQALLEQGYISDSIPMPYDHQCILRAACWEWDVDFCTMLGLYQLESTFNADAENGTHYGYGQLSQYYFPNTKDPVSNIRRSTQLIAEKLEQYGNLDAALCAYHEGHDTGDRGYSDTVKAYIRTWKEVLGE